jgi:hypothetical protein
MEHKSLRSTFKDLPAITLKPGLKLQGWQQVAVAFLLKCRDKFGFALVGDEMGVGKVIFLYSDNAE